MDEIRTPLAGVIIAFPEPAQRPVRAALREDEPRGEILLFTGVRYERLDTGPSRPAASDGQPRRRRRRS
ncbi:MAG TPA: hypothetical protein VGU24_16375 [Microvirga sp.]|jgi:hypothetical protein|nr:hypothetical protein [Microvirga sp.]